MEAKHKPGGRPKMADGKREKKITARFTADEYQTIEALETTLGVTKTDLIRMRLLHGAPAVVVNAKALITAIDSIGTELGRCGNNINQLAKYANILQKKNRANPAVIHQLNEMLAAYLEKQEELEVCLRQVIRSTGR